MIVIQIRSLVAAAICAFGLPDLFERHVLAGDAALLLDRLLLHELLDLLLGRLGLLRCPGHSEGRLLLASCEALVGLRVLEVLRQVLAEPLANDP